MTALMTIEQFNEAAGRYRRLWYLWLGIGTVLSMCAFALPAIFREPLHDYYSHRFTPQIVDVMIGLSVFPSVPLLFACMFYADHVSKKYPSFCCPHCMKVIVYNAQITIATHNCTYCGKRVLLDPN